MTAEAKAKKEPLPYSAQQRVQAVLSVWSERRHTREICRERAIHPSALYAWERRALQAMLQALEPARGQEPGPALSPELVRWETPRLCRGGSRSLTDTGVHRGNS